MSVVNDISWLADASAPLNGLSGDTRLVDPAKEIAGLVSSVGVILQVKDLTRSPILRLQSMDASPPTNNLAPVVRNPYSAAKRLGISVRAEPPRWAVTC